MRRARIYSRFPSRICAGEADEDSQPARIARATITRSSFGSQRHVGRSEFKMN